MKALSTCKNSYDGEKMITRCQLTGLQHSELDKIIEEIAPGNMVTIRHDPELDKEPVNDFDHPCDGLAWVVVCKNVKIGYIPLLSTLRDYWRKAGTQEKRDRNEKRAKATIKVRDQLRLDLERNGKEEFITVIGEITYRDGGWNQDGRGRLKMISIDMEVA